MLSHASIQNIEMDKFISVPQGLEVKVTLELRAGGDGFKPGTYYLDFEPPNTEIKFLTLHTPHTNIKTIPRAANPNPGEDRYIEVSEAVPSIQLSFTILTANLANNAVHYVSARLFDEPKKHLFSEASLALNLTQAGVVAQTKIVSKDIVSTQWKDDIILFELIKKSSARLSFKDYQGYMDYLLCGIPLDGGGDGGAKDAMHTNKPGVPALINRRFLPFNDTDAYRLLKVATEAFVAVKSVVCPATALATIFKPGELDALAASINASGVPADPVQSYVDNYLKAVNGSDHDVNPYMVLIFQKLKDSHLVDTVRGAAGLQFADAALGPCGAALRRKLACPIMIELIWSYWHEQGMLAQSMYALRDRFQNRRSGAAPDPLANMEMGYLRPLNNIIWGYIQDEQHRLTLTRRVYEYDHHYGLALLGTAVPPLQPVDSRSKFLEAFHNLLYISTIFFKEDDDTNRKADAFPILNAIKEVHFLLSEGAHNQYGDLPTTSRIEMLMEQWMLARPELQQFLPSRESIAYPEAWMGTVDAMKTVQGWTNTSVMYFHDLAVFGEQILLSIRFNNWSEVFNRANAANWARQWRSEIQAYMHAYRTVTSVDLTIEPTEPRLAERRVDPSVLLARRLDEQRQLGGIVRGGQRLPATPTAGLRLPLPPRPNPR